VRIHRWLLGLASRLVPKDLRAEWHSEWDAELSHRELVNRQWTGTRRRRLDLVRRSGGAFWDALWLQSSRWYTLRLFSRYWRLALAAVLSLSVAIAATVAGLSAYDALLVRPPGVRDPGSLRLIHISTASEPFGSASFPEYASYRDQTRAFSDIAAFPYEISSTGLGAAGLNQQVMTTEVSDNFFSVLGVTPEAGTLAFGAAISGDGEAGEVVISHALWRTLGAAMASVGKTVRLNDHAVTIEGIVPSSYHGMTWAFNPDVWMSFKTNELVFATPPGRLTDRTQQWLHMAGRLKPTVSATQAAADVQLLAKTADRERVDTRTTAHRGVLTPVMVTPPGDRGWMSTILGALLLVVVLTLVVACANVTNLLLGLATSRRHEMLIRAALGASRLQLALPLVRESAVLGGVSGVLGYGAAWVALSKLATFKPALGPIMQGLSLDLRPDALVLVATIAIALVAGVAAGLAPALRGASEGLSGSINRGFPIGEPRKARIRRVLVVIQMAVATVVLVGVGLSIHSLINLEHLPLGFSARNLVFCGVALERSGYDSRTGPALYDRIRERLTASPGIEAVTLASDAPLTGFSTDHVAAEDKAAEGSDAGRPGAGTAVPYAVVDDHYFSAIGMAVLAGRTFDARDRIGGHEVVVINATLAQRLWPGHDPLGRRVRVGDGRRVAEIIGVVPDGKYDDVDEDQLPFMYFALAQRYVPDITVIARTNGPRDTVARLLSELDPHLVLGTMSLGTLDDLVQIDLLVPRTIVWAAMAFGVLTVALAVFALYSTVFYAVSQRRAEIGIRTALGATPTHLFTLVLRESGWVALGGAGAGLVVGDLLIPLASAVFIGIGSADSIVLAGVALFSVAIALLTTFVVVRPWTRLTALALLRP
jgi:predicted permease